MLVMCFFFFCSKQYVLLSVLLCLLASGLVVFFLFPHSVLVDDDGIKVVKVTFNKQDSLVILAITVRLGLPFLGRAPSSLGLRTFTRVSSLASMQATLKIRNSNFYPVAVTSLSSQVQYMNTVVGSYLTSNVSLIPPRSEHLVRRPCRGLAPWAREKSRGGGMPYLVTSVFLSSSPLGGTG